MAAVSSTQALSTQKLLDDPVVQGAPTQPLPPSVVKIFSPEEIKANTLAANYRWAETTLFPTYEILPSGPNDLPKSEMARKEERRGMAVHCYRRIDRSIETFEQLCPKIMRKFGSDITDNLEEFAVDKTKETAKIFHHEADPSTDFIMFSMSGVCLSDLNNPESCAVVCDIWRRQVFPASDFTEETGLPILKAVPAKKT